MPWDLMVCGGAAIAFFSTITATSQARRNALSGGANGAAWLRAQNRSRPCAATGGEDRWS